MLGTDDERGAAADVVAAPDAARVAAPEEPDPEAPELFNVLEPFDVPEPPDDPDPDPEEPAPVLPPDDPAEAAAIDESAVSSAV